MKERSSHPPSLAKVLDEWRHIRYNKQEHNVTKEEKTKGVQVYMKFYLAPMEGITGYIYRNAHAAYFGPMDKYYTPFIAANAFGKLSSRELADHAAAHNAGKKVVPQILTNRAEDFIATVHTLEALGYEEVNLNLGCPSGTVVSKGRGSGFLAQREALAYFLEDIFNQSNVKVSIKTRLGKDSPEEFPELMKLFNQYPMTELIIHPRVQKDYYKNKPNLDVFMAALEEAAMPVCYNGDVFTAADYKQLITACPNLDCVMLGRGVIANPGLKDELMTHQMMTKAQLRAFHDRLFMDYQGVLSGERNVLFKMKEAWFYMIYMFSDHAKYAKKIRKSQHFKDYVQAVDTLFEEQQLVKGAGLFTTPSNN